ncbi:hypothetical protein RUND412_004727 [Rhizina undulata]
MSDQTIGFWGGMALLISSITGPGLTTIPLLFQEAGWLTPTLAFLIFGVLSGIVSLFLVETMATIRGNEEFQARVEYSTIAHLYLGPKSHVIMQVLLYCALQSVNISSIIISNQTMDTLLIQLFHKTCALSFTEGWVCVSTVSSGSPFNSYILFSLGYLISVCLVFPLSAMSLVQNIKFQLASVGVLFLVLAIWIFMFAEHGLNLSIPTVGSDQSSLMGFILNNFAFITTVPSFINELSRRVSIHKSIGYSIGLCVALFLVIGLMGAASFKIDTSSDILSTFSTSGQNKVLVSMVNILFPISVLVTSIPVFAIVMRYNLVRGNFCSNRWAIVWASLMPWVLIIPFQTKGWLTSVMNWTSLIFGSTTNFIIPLILYISSKTYHASTVSDVEGGDIFVLHRYGSSASTGSRHKSINSTLMSPKSESSLRLITTTNQKASGPTLDVPTSPLLVAYSPPVSRKGSFGHAKKPPTVSVGEVDLADGIILTVHDEGSTTASASEPVVSSDSHVYVRSRHNSTNSADFNVEARIPGSHGTTSSFQPLQGNRMASPPAIEISNQEDQLAPAFKAFPEEKWIRSMVVAKVSLAVVTCSVLGNFIYTIVETAKGNSPL